MKVFRQEEGLTLIELMIVIAIFGIVATAIVDLNIKGLHVFKFNQDQLSLKQEARNLTLRIGKDIRGVNSISIDESANSVTLDGNVIYKIEGTKELKRVEGSSERTITSKLDGSQITGIKDIFDLDPSNEFMEVNVSLSQDKSTYQLKDKIYFRKNVATSNLNDIKIYYYQASGTPTIWIWEDGGITISDDMGYTYPGPNMTAVTGTTSWYVFEIPDTYLSSPSKPLKMKFSSGSEVTRGSAKTGWYDGSSWSDSAPY